MARLEMSPTLSTGHHDALDDTPPHGVPPVSRAAIAAAERERAELDGAEEAGGRDDERIAAPRGDGRTREPQAADGSAARGLIRSGTTPVGERVPEMPRRVTREHAGRARPPARTYETGGRRHGRLTRRGRVIAAALAVVVVLGGLFAWYETEANPFGKPGKPVLVEVKSGESLGTIEAALAQHGVIGTSLAFHLWSFVHGSPTAYPGTYDLRQNLSFSTAKAALDAGPNVAAVTVVPGTTISEIARQLTSIRSNLAQAFAHAGAASGVHSPFQPAGATSLEGLIGSGTYRVLPGESGRALLAKMVARFVTEARSVGLTPTTKIAGLDAYQLVTLASITQKEGYFTRYMGQVARVIFNRLGDGMQLDMTSTVLYSLGKDGGQVTPQEEQQTTPYNTYLHAGLTPTPICTPSLTALHSAVHAPAGTWLYFDLVTAKNSIMKFASTYTQQQALIQEAAQNAAKNASSSSGSSGSTT
jgi:UPF0755 protein